MTRHGEYKAPGGKLVVVDCIVEAGRLRRVRVSGDFFLFPDEAIHKLAAAFEGMPANASRPELAHRAKDALADAETVGFSADDVAEAMLRALASGGCQPPELASGGCEPPELP